MVLLTLILVLYSFQYTVLSNPFLQSFVGSWFYFADNATTVTCHWLFDTKSITIMIRISTAVLLAPFEAKTQYFFHLCFNLILQLISDILSNLQKSLRYLNSTAIAVLLKIPLALLPSMSPNSLALYLNYLKVSSLELLLLNLLVYSFE